MIILQYVKQSDMAYVSHKDLLRVLQRGLRRMKAQVFFSQGFIPHMLTYMTSPIPLGVQSTAEYFAVECKETDAAEFLQRYNDAMPTGVRATRAWYVPKNPNLAAVVSASVYAIPAPQANAREIASCMQDAQWMIEEVKKNVTRTVDIRPLIYDMQCKDGILYLTLATGSNANLRIDTALQALHDRFGYDLRVQDACRIAQRIGDPSQLKDVEEVLQ